MKHVLSSDDAVLAEFTRLRDNRLFEMGLFVAEGPKVVKKLLVSGLKVLKLVGPEEFIEECAELLRAHPEADCLCTPKEVLEGAVGFPLHKGIMALAERPKNPKAVDIQAPMLVFDGVTGPENIGSMTRSAVAFGVTSLLVGPDSCSPFVRRCVRVSMGNVFRTNVAHSHDLLADLEKLKKRGVKIISTANVPGAHTAAPTFFHGPCALVIGSEGHGIKKSVLDTSDIILRIPVDDQVEHLNAANAASIFLFLMAQAQLTGNSPTGPG